VILGFSGNAVVPAKAGATAAKGSVERSTRAPLRRQGTSEVTLSGEAPSAERRRGSASLREDMTTPENGEDQTHVLRRTERGRSCHGEKTVTFGDGIDSANCTTLHSEAG